MPLTGFRLHLTGLLPLTGFRPSLIGFRPHLTRLPGKALQPARHLPGRSLGLPARAARASQRGRDGAGPASPAAAPQAVQQQRRAERGAGVRRDRITMVCRQVQSAQRGGGGALRGSLSLGGFRG